MRSTCGSCRLPGGGRTAREVAEPVRSHRRLGEHRHHREAPRELVRTRSISGSSVRARAARTGSVVSVAARLWFTTQAYGSMPARRRSSWSSRPR
jgi:hypothetical protein